MFHSYVEREVAVPSSRTDVNIRARAGSVQAMVGKGILRTETRKVRNRLGRGQECPSGQQLAEDLCGIKEEKRWLKTSAWDCEHMLSGIFLWVHLGLKVPREDLSLFLPGTPRV